MADKPATLIKIECWGFNEENQRDTFLKGIKSKIQEVAPELILEGGYQFQFIFVNASCVDWNGRNIRYVKVYSTDSGGLTATRIKHILNETDSELDVKDYYLNY